MRIGARTSRLSRAQTAVVSDLLERQFGDDLELEFVPVKTLGDRRPPEERGEGRAGAKGSFTGDLEGLLLAGKIDLAVHSLKDMTSEGAPGLSLGATPTRGDPRDALVTTHGERIEALPKRARVGTSSLRRKAQLLKLRGDIEVTEIHGNVDTRLEKLGVGEGGFDAVVLAAAGLARLGEAARISQTFSIDEMVPAVGQGVIAVQMRDGDREVAKALSRIDDETTRVESRCEVAFARRLGADCTVPVGGCARASGKTLRVVGMLAGEDGKGMRRASLSGRAEEAPELGRRLAEALLEGGGSAAV